MAEATSVEHSASADRSPREARTFAPDALADRSPEVNRDRRTRAIADTSPPQARPSYRPARPSASPTPAGGRRRRAGLATPSARGRVGRILTDPAQTSGRMARGSVGAMTKRLTMRWFEAALAVRGG